MVTDGWSLDSFRTPQPDHAATTARRKALVADTRRRLAGARRATVSALGGSAGWINDRLDSALSTVGLGFLSLATFVSFGTGPGLYATGAAFLLAALMARD